MDGEEQNPIRAELERGLEDFLFSPRSMPPLAGDFESLATVLRSVVEIHVHIDRLPRDFVWIVLRAAYDEALTDPGKGEEESRLWNAVTHLMALGDYSQGAEYEGVSNFQFETFLKKNGIDRSLDNFALKISQNKTAREAFASLASGLGGGRQTFQKGRGSREKVVHLFADAVEDLLTSNEKILAAIGTSERPATVGADINRAIVRGGWGPPRPSVSSLSRPARVILNSIFNHPTYGDERNFVRVRPADQAKADYVDHISVTHGERYEVLIHFSNGARTGSGLDAIDTRVRVQAPRSFEGSGRVTAFLSARNAEPSVVWDSFVVSLNRPNSRAALRCVPDSAFAVIGEEAVSVDDDLYRPAGTLVGYSSLNGVIPPSEGFTGFLGFQFQIDNPDFTATGRLRRIGEKEWSSDFFDVHPGDALEVVLMYHNSGTTVQKDVVVGMSPLPRELVYTEGSTKISNQKSNFSYRATSSAMTDRINVGNYAPGGGCYVKCEILVKDDAALGRGPSHWLVLERFGFVQTNNGTKSFDLTLKLMR